MKSILLRIWRLLPGGMQYLASLLIRPRYQVAVGALIFNPQGQLLLCEHTYRRLHPWGLPGGDLKFGEDPLDGIRRELLEETGLTVDDARLLLVENSTTIRHISLTYLCTGVRGSFIPNDEVSAIRYFDPGDLPDFFEEQGITIRKCLQMLDAGK